MHRIVIILFFACISVIDSLCAEQDFCVITIPKSGTHLLTTLIEQLTNKKYTSPSHGLSGLEFFGPLTKKGISIPEMNRWFAQCKKNRTYPLAHTNYSYPLFNYTRLHPEYVTILQVRDLRDVCVSYTFFRKQRLDMYLGPNASFSDRLMFVIKKLEPSPEQRISSMQLFADYSLIWLERKNVIISRFEELVGPLGGGTLAKQLNLLRKITTLLGFNYNNAELEAIGKNIYGHSATFRKGKVGSWKQYFTKAHKEEFKKRMGSALIRLGYEKDSNW